MSDLPYRAEYASSGRAGCKGCKDKIEQGKLRIARMVQSAFHDGKQPNWYHEECFFEKQRPKSVDEVGNFNKLKSADQKRLSTKIDEVSQGAVVMVANEKPKGKSKKRAATAVVGALKDFGVEYAKSSRASCKHCEIKICKDEVRIRKTVFDTEIGSKYGGQPLWHHVKCFAEARHELQFFAGGDVLPGFSDLAEEDQKMIKEIVKPLDSGEVPIKKLKSEKPDPEEQKLEKTMKKQNDLYQKYKTGLGKFSAGDVESLLEANSQEVPQNKREAVDLLADCMAFGALKPCPECKNGQLVLDTFGYKCTGHISGFTSCAYITQDPKRVPLVVPSSFSDRSLFKKYKPKADVRVFRSAPKPVLPVKKEETVVKKEVRNPPLKNLQFFIYGRDLSKDKKEEIKRRILKLGGLVVSKLTETAAAVVSTKKEIERMSEKMEEVSEKEIEVVEESFLDLIHPENGSVSESMRLIRENNIATWGSDPITRVPQDVIDGKSIAKSGSNYAKSSKSGPVKIKIKDGSAVDPASGLADSTHVYADPEGTKYSVVLSKTDIVSGKNSYYKLQLLKSDVADMFYLFRAWGRIGTPIGGNKTENFRSLPDAVRQFKFFYQDKTQNDWDCREYFEKVPGAYYPHDVDYSDGDKKENLRAMELDSKCSLPEPVQKLVQKIFDTNAMKQTMLEFELDTEKMPLGKISQKQITQGYKVLSELLKYIEKGKVNQSKVIDATNRFFTIIPHDFGTENPPLLDSADLVRAKCQMLDNLLEIEIAYSILNTDSKSTGSVVEESYKKLRTEITPLDRNSKEFKMIEEYTKNTHAATHSAYTLEIEEVFKVVRDGEEKRYKPFKKLHNRRLLWHGSRVTNFAGILSQGLRIAPPEAPVTGYMFGKGIYFADMVSKSANYCCTSKDKPVGVMLLCEVALGNMKECRKAEYVTKLPAGTHSVFGAGRTEPDPAHALKLDDDTLVPLGPPLASDRKCDLLYNEYIVYDVAQVNVKYLLQMKFNFKY
ncbi:poly [ADP-ribose] polymerase isoform X1 [Amyelois transitella]|uniref:poly [ADP-ribose] polymerase isoform X1 n=1 Tax=Amyelois transitella TaxID=680683 RepID=UPI002990452B|nr:poly [ADP-ribose] polymerase isoform X1 [Amyelois transitella]